MSRQNSVTLLSILRVKGRFLFPKSGLETPPGEGLEGTTDRRDGSISMQNENLKEDVCTGAQSANG